MLFSHLLQCFYHQQNKWKWQKEVHLKKTLDNQCKCQSIFIVSINVPLWKSMNIGFTIGIRQAKKTRNSWPLTCFCFAKGIIAAAAVLRENPKVLFLCCQVIKYLITFTPKLEHHKNNKLHHQQMWSDSNCRFRRCSWKCHSHWLGFLLWSHCMTFVTLPNSQTKHHNETSWILSVIDF